MSNELRLLESDLKKLLESRQKAAMRLYRPYAKQSTFHNMGVEKTERLFQAGNQLGKTLAGSMEMAYHLTGKYPEWWKGRRWDRPIKAWASANTGQQVRDGVQKYLMGEAGVVEAQGTGAIPRDDIKDTSTARGVADLYDTVQVQHYTAAGVKDGISILRFKTYDQGRPKWQSETLDCVWFDEEPPEDIYSEGVTRTVARAGMTYLTFTPLLGQSNVVKMFGDIREPHRGKVMMTIDDAEHYTPEQRRLTVAKYPAHEREARAKGVPFLGSGRIFLTPEENISIAAFPLPKHWVYLWGLDFGISHPFAAVLIGWDRDADCIYVVRTVRMKALYGQTITPLQHSEAIKAAYFGHGGEIPHAWPQDGTKREIDSKGKSVADIYKKHGLRMLEEHATWPDGGLSTEAAILELDERMTTGRFKVFSHLMEWFEEYRSYHRDEGQIVKVDDDLQSATQKAIMMKRAAKLLPDHDPRRAKTAVKMAADVDFPVT
jgi:phage terminase large subunit-like protein